MHLPQNETLQLGGGSSSFEEPKVQTNGETKSQSNGDAHIQTNGVAEVQSNGDTTSSKIGATEPQINGDSKAQTNGHAEPQTNGDAKPHINGNTIPPTDRVVEPQTNGDAYVKKNGEVKVQTNGLSTKPSETNGTLSLPTLPNQVSIHILDTLVDSVIAGWILLVQRYQRDSFHNFTWGLADSGDSVVQTVATTELKLESVVTVADLLAVVRGVRSREIKVEGTEPVLVLNDGTKDEWSFSANITFTHTITATSSWRAPNMSQHQAVSQLHFFSSILNTIFLSPTTPTTALLSISELELEEIWGWNTPMPPSLDTCMHDIISEQALLQPEKIAIEAWDGSLTYAQVERFSTELAQNLLLLEHAPQPIIPVLFEKSRWTIVAVLAVMKAGACFALLDPAQPEGRLRVIIQQINANLVVASKTQSTLAARIAPSATIIPISESKFEKLYHPVAEQQPRTSLPPVSPSAALYIQFTSGSTGLPKGCIISHSQYTSGALPRAYDVGYRTHSRVLDFASYAFDVCIDSMLCTLAHGGTLCTPSEEKRMNDLSGAMREMRVTLAGMTPSVARTLDLDILSSLDSIALGGEGVSASDAASWGKKTKVVNAYGPSECTVGATINENVGAKPYITMGKGKGCAIWLVDPADHNKLVPVGAVGELLIEGPIVGDGYLNNPAKTKEVFIEDPEFLLAGTKKTPGRKGRMYKSGDLVRYDPDGQGEVIFVGRQDQQVKLRGQRIELAEIEYNMQKHLPSDTQLATEVIKPGGSSEPTLVAFLVEQKKSGMRHLDGDIFASFSNKFQKALQEMTQHLFSDLPGYMVPTAYIPLWKMPLLVSCKTDRKRLREIGTSVTRQDLRRFNSIMSEKKEPTTEMELRLRPLWAKVLGGEDDFGANDNFFSMGGDSLRAMKLVAAARGDKIDLSVPDIMLNPTLSAMAAKATPLSSEANLDIPAFSLIDKDWKAEDAQAEAAVLCGVEASLVEDVYPCTPLQEGLMALSAKFLDAYVAQRVVELPLEAAQNLQRAFDKAASDAPILRTRVVNVPGRGLFQVVLKDGQLVRSGTSLAEYLKTDREEPMDLGKALFRYSVVSGPESSSAHVVITMHHAVYDGWSMPLIIERVNRAYGAGLETSRPSTFKHFIKHLSGLDRSISETYWRDRLEGASPHQFPPLPSPGYITQADSLLEHYVSVPTSAHSKLTLATIIRGAWALVSSLYTGAPDVVFGETLTGRSAAVFGIEQIEGPMITTIPVRVRLSLDRPISEYLQTLHAQTVQQIPHEHLGLQNIRRLSRDARQACDLRTGLVLHPKEDESWSGSEAIEDAPANRFMPTDDAEAAREALKFNTYALMLVCTLDENGFLVMASFDSKTISSPAMERVLAVLDRIVTAFLGNPESKLGDVAVLDNEEKEDADKIRPKDAMVDSMIESAPVTNGHKSGDASALSENEIKLQKLLSRILGIAETEINPSDSFFELGGDSISAMRLVSESRAQGLKITVAQIFQSRSLSALGASIGSEKEEKLFELLSRILGIPKNEISPSDSFFELGGDSIGAMRLVSEARAQGLKITVAQIFQSRSLSSLASGAEELESQSLVPSSDIDTPFAALGDEKNLFSPDRIISLLENPEWNIVDIYPTRPLQQLAVEGTVDLPRYSLRYELIQFASPIDSSKLRHSCQELVALNEVLRTVFIEDGGRCLGVVLESLQVPFEEVTVPEGEDLKTFATDASHKDIEEPKPHGSSFVGFRLFKASTGESTLAFRISHAQYDEMCLPLLFQQLSALYTGTSVPESEPYSRHVNHVVANNIPQSIPYWRELLSGSQMSVFTPSIPLTHRKATSIYREFDISSRPKDITIGSLPTAAWAVTLARRLSKRDVVFGEVVSGRNIGVANADRVFGPTWQYIPFRVPFASNPSWTYLELLQFVQKQHIESAGFEGVGFSEIVNGCTDWDPKEVAWFDTVVHQAPEWVETMDFGGLKAQFDTIYPHAEPLREWKCQAFVKDGGKKLGIEIVTFEEWGPVAEEVIGEVGEVLAQLMEGKASETVFERSSGVIDVATEQVGVENANNGEAPNESAEAEDAAKKAQLEDFLGVM
ncbi:nonribosomal peptide synthetase-like protein [Melanomma pulvis-pyrius CBS 109.77]|uniref:Nonribosomal peptide synthetase-like protein n=1 Tax=Melanomma pulvis-pyrius CBS 109.77 TaxID=1314802 RepID=A0A6A6XAK3_9PLEO|nr:nonribosomal peptide synthetase-like protein [Melanomma pulvis-pyrius CBS 109.77]